MSNEDTASMIDGYVGAPQGLPVQLLDLMRLTRQQGLATHEKVCAIEKDTPKRLRHIKKQIKVVEHLVRTGGAAQSGNLGGPPVDQSTSESSTEASPGNTTGQEPPSYGLAELTATMELHRADLRSLNDHIAQLYKQNAEKQDLLKSLQDDVCQLHERDSEQARQLEQRDFQNFSQHESQGSQHESQSSQHESQGNTLKSEIKSLFSRKHRRKNQREDDA